MIFARIICIDRVYCTQVEKLVCREMTEADSWLVPRPRHPSESARTACEQLGCVKPREGRIDQRSGVRARPREPVQCNVLHAGQVRSDSVCGHALGEFLERRHCSLRRPLGPTVPALRELGLHVLTAPRAGPGPRGGPLGRLVVSLKTAINTCLAVAFDGPTCSELFLASFIEGRLDHLSCLPYLRFVQCPKLWPRTVTQRTRARRSDLAHDSM